MHLEPQLLYGHVRDARFRIVDKLKLARPQRGKVEDPLVFFVWPEFRFQNRVGKNRLEVGHGLAVARHVNVQGAITLRENKDNLKSGMVCATLEFFVLPFDARPRIVFGIGEKIIEIIAFVAVNLAVLPAPLRGVKKTTELLLQLADTYGVYVGGLTWQIFTLAPVRAGHRVRPIKGDRTAPILGTLKKGPKSVLVKAAECGELRCQVFAMPIGFVQDGFRSALGGKFVNFLKVLF